MKRYTKEVSAQIDYVRCERGERFQKFLQNKLAVKLAQHLLESGLVQISNEKTPEGGGRIHATITLAKGE